MHSFLSGRDNLRPYMSTRREKYSPSVAGGSWVQLCRSAEESDVWYSNEITEYLEHMGQSIVTSGISMLSASICSMRRKSVASYSSRRSFFISTEQYVSNPFGANASW